MFEEDSTNCLGKITMMNSRRFFNIIMLALATGLFASNAYFYYKSRAYGQMNRKLILQNDSIMSVNLELLQDKVKQPRTSMVYHE